MIENKEVMARNIKRYMNSKGVTSIDVCKALGFKQNTFSDWINAKAYPRIDKIQLMADYFGISKSFLVEDIVPITHFTQDEIDIINDYRNADENTRNMVKRMLQYSKIEKEGLI